MLIETSGLIKYFGGLAAVNGFDMYVKEGEMVGLIGPNGAGKTTIFNLIIGLTCSRFRDRCAAFIT
jgi:ABC-type branched-subunit amino acid transport system ATPase component